MPNNTCAVSWCIALEARPGENFCAVHRDSSIPRNFPPPVRRELQRRYDEETAQRSATRQRAVR